MASWWTISVPGERRTIDLNADIGEASDATGVLAERALLGVVTSAHIACGGHAGDEESMRAMVTPAPLVTGHAWSGARRSWAHGV